jgi:hypothetical protein
MAPDEKLPGKPRDDTGPNEDVAEESDQLIRGESPDSESVPASPAHRRLEMLTAFVFIAIILTFLGWFIAMQAARH